MSLSAYFSSALIDTLRGVDFTAPANIYLALFTVMPDRDGTGGTEVAGGSYGRQILSLGADSDGVAVNVTVMEYPTMPACTIVGGGTYDAISGGNLLTYGLLSTPRTVTAGVDLILEAGDVVEVLR